MTTIMVRMHDSGPPLVHVVAITMPLENSWLIVCQGVQANEYNGRSEPTNKQASDRDPVSMGTVINWAHH